MVQEDWTPQWERESQSAWRRAAQEELRKEPGVGFYVPSNRQKKRRRERAEEAGYSPREQEIIASAPIKLTKKMWQRAFKARHREMVQYMEEEGYRYPMSHYEWEMYRKGQAFGDIEERIANWKEAAHRIDTWWGVLSIWDILDQT